MIILSLDLVAFFPLENSVKMLGGQDNKGEKRMEKFQYRKGDALNFLSK